MIRNKDENPQNLSVLQPHRTVVFFLLVSIFQIYYFLCSCGFMTWGKKEGVLPAVKIAQLSFQFDPELKFSLHTECISRGRQLSPHRLVETNLQRTENANATTTAEKCSSPFSGRAIKLEMISIKSHVWQFGENPRWHANEGKNSADPVEFGEEKVLRPNAYYESK